MKPAPTAGRAIWDTNTPYKGKITIYDDSIFIADAALYLKATQPDLGIDNPYQLNDEQFNASVDCSRGSPERRRVVGRLREADPVVREQGRRDRDDLAVPGQHLKADKKPVEGIKPKEGTTGWSDTWMIYSKASTRTACTSG